MREEVYIHRPQGIKCNVTVNLEEKVIYQLREALYGLRQSGNLWHNNISDYLTELGFKKNHAFPSTFIKVNTEGIVCATIGIFVDDFLITADSEHELDSIVRLLMAKYTIKIIAADNDGKQKYLDTDPKVERGNDNQVVSILLDQEQYIINSCREYDIQSPNRMLKTPLTPSFFFTSIEMITHSTSINES